MKKSLLLAFLLFSLNIIFAQNQLLVQKGDKGLYLNHKVVAKENYYSIGRLYNANPKDIASYNGMDMNKGLAVGQVLRIPLNATNFTQKSGQGRPVYYTVGQKEGLYRVSQNNNDVLMASLRKWNKLTSDNISTGQKLIVGYLVSPEANNIVVTNTDVAQEKTEVVEAPKQEVVKNDPPVEKKETETIVKKEEEVKPKSEPPVVQVAVSDGKGGYFKTSYDAQIKTQPIKKDVTASAGIFKTASGWQDAKYYALIDGVEPGTIIKVSNPTNNKVIYAKVLGEMSGIRQNVGYDIRISNAAASVLDVTDAEKFVVKVNY